MKLLVGLFAGALAQGPGGKSTIASSHPMQSMQFLLKYLPVTVAEDNGVGNYGHGAVQGRMQTLKALSYKEPNCQLYSTANALTSVSGAESAAPSSITQRDSIGHACTYESGKSYGSANKMHTVYAYNKNQCCNACISTTGCAASTFTTSSNDHTGGFGPQSWEGFGIHLPNVQAAKTTGGLSVDELTEKYVSRIGDHSAFDDFMDYSVTFFTYDLQHYIDIFKADGVAHFLGQWKDQQSRQWYSLIFLVPSSSYVIELVSQHADVASSVPEMEQRMSDAACNKWVNGKSYENKAILVQSINRATSDISAIEDAYVNKFKMTSTHKLTTSTVERRCYDGSWGDVCFIQRQASEKDAIFSVKDHEDNLWAIHAGTMKTSPSVTDKMTDSHGQYNIPQAGITALKTYYNSMSFAKLLESRLAYACFQSYVIDPTGFSIQAAGPGASLWPNCSSDDESGDDEREMVVA